MIRRVVPFRRWHAAWLMEHGTAEALSLFDTDTMICLEKQNSWTLVVDGDPVICGGTITQWPGRSMAWAHLSTLAAPHMLYITRGVRRLLAEVPGRIEVTVRCDFAKGHAWARMLGFEIETPVLRAFGPAGEDHTGYVRFN